MNGAKIFSLFRRSNKVGSFLILIIINILNNHIRVMVLPIIFSVESYRLTCAVNVKTVVCVTTVNI